MYYGLLHVCKISVSWLHLVPDVSDVVGNGNMTSLTGCKFWKSQQQMTAFLAEVRRCILLASVLEQQQNQQLPARASSVGHQKRQPQAQELTDVSLPPSATAACAGQRRDGFAK